MDGLGWKIHENPMKKIGWFRVPFQEDSYGGLHEDPQKQDGLENPIEMDDLGVPYIRKPRDSKDSKWKNRGILV